MMTRDFLTGKWKRCTIVRLHDDLDDFDGFEPGKGNTSGLPKIGKINIKQINLLLWNIIQRSESIV